MKTIIYLSLLSMLVFTSCKKKSITPITPYITIANTSDMEIKSIDSTVSPPYSPFLSQTYSDFDVNDDGENDFRISIFYSYSPGGGAHGRQILTLLNNKITLMGNAFDDSVFIKLDTTIMNFGLGMFNVNMYKRYYFTRLGLNDSLSSLNHYTLKPHVFAAGELMKQANNFGKVETILLDDNTYQTDTTQKGYTSKDSTYAYFINQKINEYPYPMNSDLYFGFKFYDGTFTRLGWIKFKITGKGSLHIFETSIQKN